MNFSQSEHGDVLIVRVEEERIDAACAIQFKDAMQAVGRCGKPRVILDLERVDFLDSSGLGAVVAVMKFFSPGITLELAGLTPIVAKVFRLTRMDQVFRIHDRADAAVALST